MVDASRAKHSLAWIQAVVSVGSALAGAEDSVEMYLLDTARFCVQAC